MISQSLHSPAPHMGSLLALFYFFISDCYLNDGRIHHRHHCTDLISWFKICLDTEGGAPSSLPFPPIKFCDHAAETTGRQHRTLWIRGSSLPRGKRKNFQGVGLSVVCLFYLCMSQGKKIEQPFLLFLPTPHPHRPSHL